MLKKQILFILLANILALAQSNQETIFTIQANSEISVPANQIIFRINIQEENNDPEQAYNIHKNKEEQLVKLLKGYSIPDSNVVYSLLSISQPRQQKSNTYKTSQSIQLKISDFDLYEKLQVGLLKIGINNFSSLFSSTKTSEIKEKAISSLIYDAKNEAETYARNLGLEVGKVKEIETRMGRVDVGQPTYFVATPSVDYSLLEIPQTYKVNVFAKISFYLK
jgi:uncharacterized protein